jgi:hypothetical protein
MQIGLLSAAGSKLRAHGGGFCALRGGIGARNGRQMQWTWCTRAATGISTGAAQLEAISKTSDTAGGWR